jgi:hypothetical protein
MLGIAKPRCGIEMHPAVDVGPECTALAVTVWIAFAAREDHVFQLHGFIGKSIALHDCSTK